MKIALLMNKNSYVGREYLDALNKAKISVDIICIGDYPEESRVEEERCAGLWKPPIFENIINGNKVKYFDNLNNRDLQKFLEEEQYDVGIQGGVGILKADVIKRFKRGILNFHPGKLPEYRGCSAPEWQIREGQPVMCTCHLVDEGIDSGRIYAMQRLNVPTNNYYEMRASIYPKISEMLVDILKNITPNFVEQCTLQDEKKAVYRKYIGDDAIEELKKEMQENKK